MFQISKAPLPQSALLNTYAQRRGHHADCFETAVPFDSHLPAYIEAFFNSAVLRLERRVLGCIGMPSTAADVAGLADGTNPKLAGWTLEARNEHQILLTVRGDQIRTWLMVETGSDETRLLFGSAVVPKNPEADKPKLGFPVTALMGFHNFYSRIVLWSARRRLMRRHTS